MRTISFLFVFVAFCFFCAVHAESPAITGELTIITGDKNAPVDSVIILESVLFSLEDKIEQVAPPFKNVKQRAEYFRLKTELEDTRVQYAYHISKSSLNDELITQARITAYKARRLSSMYKLKYEQALASLSGEAMPPQIRR